MGRTCRECHFLAKEYRDGGSAVHTFSLKPDERRALPARSDRYALNCHKGVWDEGLGMNAEALLREISRADREESCFFFPYRESMLFPAADELQKRAAENAQMKKSHRHAVVGLWIAAIGLVASVAVSIVELALR